MHSIGVGKWRDKIDAALAQSAVCVAVIGPRWASAENLARLEDESDMVRHELATALASDGLTNHVTDEDLRDGPWRFPDPQQWADHLVQLALERGSRDNVTCVVVAFEKE